MVLFVKFFKYLVNLSQFFNIAIIFCCTWSLNAWAHLVQSGKYASLDVSPDMPFFRGKKKAKDSNHSTPLENAESSSSTPQSTSSVGVSPGRRVGLRTECIDQLKKWHALLVDGAISKAQYDDLQATILNDMHKFEKVLNCGK